LKSLDETGVAVISQALSSEEIQKAKDLFWDWAEGLGKELDRNDQKSCTNARWCGSRYGFN
jgi:hypothetical protein